MSSQFKPNRAHYFIAAVWLINGLFCKVLNLVPRHEAIVSRILHTDNARPLAILIGMAEFGMAAWIISGIHRRLNVVTQILLIAMMNAPEFFLAGTDFVIVALAADFHPQAVGLVRLDGLPALLEAEQSGNRERIVANHLGLQTVPRAAGVEQILVVARNDREDNAVVRAVFGDGRKDQHFVAINGVLNRQVVAATCRRGER